MRSTTWSLWITRASTSNRMTPRSWGLRAYSMRLRASMMRWAGWATSPSALVSMFSLAFTLQSLRAAASFFMSRVRHNFWFLVYILDLKLIVTVSPSSSFLIYHSGFSLYLWSPSPYFSQQLSCICGNPFIYLSLKSVGNPCHSAHLPGVYIVLGAKNRVI